MHSSRNKRFMLDEMTYQNASKFAICLEYKNPSCFFHFSLCYLIFSLINIISSSTKWKSSSQVQVSSIPSWRNLNLSGVKNLTTWTFYVIFVNWNIIPIWDQPRSFEVTWGHMWLVEDIQVWSRLAAELLLQKLKNSDENILVIQVRNSKN